MSTQVPGAPPAAPPQGPPPPQVGTTFVDPNGEPRGTVQVSRNVPPKRVMVAQGSITYAGQSYGVGDTFLIGEGPVADAWAMNGQVVIVSHEEIDAWNGSEGNEIRARAARHIQNTAAELGAAAAFHDYLHGNITQGELHKGIEDARKSAPTMAEDHPGFTTYEHADGEQGYPADVTTYRQQLAAEHLARGGTMSDDQARPGRKEES